MRQDSKKKRKRGLKPALDSDIYNIFHQNTERSNTGEVADNNLYEDVSGVNDDEKTSRRRSGEFDIAMNSGTNSIEALNLEGLTSTQARDIEQILHIKLLVKYFFHRELSEAKGGKHQKRQDLIRLIGEINEKESQAMLTDLKQYFDDHKDTSGQRNILSSVILVTYTDESGENRTEPFKLSGNARAYNILNHNVAEFNKLMTGAHKASASSIAMHDFHTEAALMVSLIKDIPAIRAKYGNQIERISICVDSRLSGCNSCVEKIQSIRNQLLGDIRVSVAYNFASNFSGKMGQSDESASAASSNSSPTTDSKAQNSQSSSGDNSLALPFASPMLTSNDKPLHHTRFTHPNRSPDKKSFIRSIMANSDIFLSGSSESKNFSPTVTNLLEEYSRALNGIINKITDQVFPTKIPAQHNTTGLTMNDLDDGLDNAAGHLDALIASCSGTTNESFYQK